MPEGMPNDAAMTQPQVGYAMQQAWVGFWHSCMAGVGAKSRLPFDAEAVDAVLNGHELMLPPETLPIGLPAPAPPVAEQSGWAQQLEGDERIKGVTLGDVLFALDDYFKIFSEMKRVNRGAFDYFSRVGAPIVLDSSFIYSKLIDAAPTTPLIDPASLPAYLGLFFPRSKKEDRDRWLNDKPTFLDFQVYEKRRRNIAVVAPWKYTIYDHQEYSLDRDALTREERRKFPAYGTWGFHYFIGIDAAGLVHALPMHMPTYQQLPRGGGITHQRFLVPPALKDMAGKKTSVDGYCAVMFAVMRGFAANALLGVQLSIRKGDQVARFGIPLSSVRGFFRDRDPDRVRGRRNPLLHFVATHPRKLADGRTIYVGEHLRGARHFTWRGYNIIASAPGIHHPSPEALVAEALEDDDLLPLPKDVVKIGRVAEKMQEVIETAPRSRFRKGQPMVRYRTHGLETPEMQRMTS